ncbi:MAG: FAD-dependent oxidoreductase [Alphaproteobacteria bacterium]|nr:FAD-dependent oxidoreductase [Alphaproteobacteria bacterium]
MDAQAQIVIVGGGQAGGWVARTLRDQGHAGAIVLVGEEPHPPYERPPLSKGLLLGTAKPESTQLFPGEAWTKLRIDHRAGMRATRIERSAHRVALSDGTLIDYGALVLATGARVRRLPLDGAALPGVHYLRDLADSAAIAADLERPGRLLVIGGGWIGLEVAAAARKRGRDVTLVEAAPRLCNRALPPDLAEHLATIHAAHGVELRLGKTVTRLEGQGRVSRAVFSDGATLDVGAVVIGIGVQPNAELAAEAGLEIDPANGGIVVDDNGRTADPAIFAAGDVASHPNDLVGRRIRLESWENAQNQAIHVAKAIRGTAGGPYAEVPWFWSDQYDVNIQLVGLPQRWDRTATRGDPASGTFLVAYFDGPALVGAAAFNAGRDLRFVRRMMQLRVAVAPERLADPQVKLQDLLKPAH